MTDGNAAVEIGLVCFGQVAEMTGQSTVLLVCSDTAQSPPGANRLIFLPDTYGECLPIWD